MPAAVEQNNMKTSTMKYKNEVDVPADLTNVKGSAAAELKTEASISCH